MPECFAALLLDLRILPLLHFRNIGEHVLVQFYPEVLVSLDELRTMQDVP